MCNANFADSIEKYIKYLTFLKEDYPNSPIATSPINTSFLFRGISNNSYALLPSVYRMHYGKSENMSIENSLFLTFANEKAIINEFRNEARHYLTGTNLDNFIHWAEYAQHYNVPTRFLDWTSNPLVALFFACSSSESDDGVVWCLHQRNYYRFTHKADTKEKWEGLNGIPIYNLYEEMLDGSKDLPFPIIYTPNYIDTRMSAQSSLFLLWGNDRRPLDEIIGKDYYIEYIEHNDGIYSYGTDQDTKILMKITVKSFMKQSLLRSLDMLGISKKTLFPGLDGLGTHLRWKYQFNANDEF